MGWLEDRLEGDTLVTVNDLYEKFGFRHVMGIGINGQRSIVGPISLASVILPPEHRIKGIDSSTNLTSTEVEQIATLIKQGATEAQVSWGSFNDIVKIGKDFAVERGISFLLSSVNEYNPISLILIDGFELSSIPIGTKKAKVPIFSSQKTGVVMEIVIVANILARSAREGFMKILNNEYPEYKWDHNMGFPTQQHIEAIKEFGITPYHRDLSGLKSLKDWDAFPNERGLKNVFSNYRR